MSKVPKNLQDDATSEYLQKNGLNRIHQGKVRDTYFLSNEELLVRATNRISIFDFVLNALIPYKGEVLTALTHFWLTRVLKNFQHHLIQSKKHPELNAAYDLQEKFPDLPARSFLVVKNLSSLLYVFEMIFRHYIGGSVFKTYQQTGKAGGHEITPNLPKWSKLEKPIFTPSTKEEVGHDVNVNFEYFFKVMEEKGLSEEAHKVVEMLAEVYAIAYAYAEERGILIMDTKFEVAGMTIVDEILTPDSPRFTFAEDWKRAMEEGREPQFFDKQPVRDWGSTIETPFLKEGKQITGINKLDPKNPEHVAFVHDLVVPIGVIEDASERYLHIFKSLTGCELKEYQVKEMGV